MIGAFDRIDKQFASKTIQHEEPSAGDACANPKCNGRLSVTMVYTTGGSTKLYFCATCNIPAKWSREQ